MAELSREDAAFPGSWRRTRSRGRGGGPGTQLQGRGGDGGILSGQVREPGGKVGRLPATRVAHVPNRRALNWTQARRCGILRCWTNAEDAEKQNRPEYPRRCATPGLRPGRGRLHRRTDGLVLQRVCAQLLDQAFEDSAVKCREPVDLLLRAEERPERPTPICRSRSWFKIGEPPVPDIRYVVLIR